MFSVVSHADGDALFRSSMETAIHIYIDRSVQYPMQICYYVAAYFKVQICTSTNTQSRTSDALDIVIRAGEPEILYIKVHVYMK